MAELRSPTFQNSGQSVVAGMTPRGSSSAGKPISDMSIEEMEGALTARATRKPQPEAIRANCAPQTARGLLEENKQLILDKQERKAMARQNSREFFEKLLAQDRLTTDSDKARDISRRRAQRELAQYYKSKIAEKESAKASNYQEKVQTGGEIQYFPFVEGENINKNREAKSQQMREEMRGFLQKQRDAKPVRAGESRQAALEYPVTSQRWAQPAGAQPEDGGDAGEEVAPNLARHPRFLSRAREHMSRRLHDVHVRKALEEKVLETKRALDAQAEEKQFARREFEDGMLVNDALRYDSGKSMAVERKRNQEFLEAQIQERKDRARREVAERRSEPPGYWGPEEKELQDDGMHKAHCYHLIKQMEVDELRKVNSRQLRIQQEKRMIDNCMAEMTRDREVERTKVANQREVLTTTWKSQQKIKTAMKAIEAL